MKIIKHTSLILELDANDISKIIDLLELSQLLINEKLKQEQTCFMGYALRGNNAFIHEIYGAIK